MPQFHWRIPIHGDKGDLGSRHYTRGNWGPQLDGNQAPTVLNGRADKTPYHDYLLQVAKAAEIAGFDGALIPSFPNSEDPWVIASSIARYTKTLRFMIAYQPMWFDPLQAAKASASLQRLSGGRLLFNIITGGGGPGQLWWGDRIAHDDRYVRTTEFLDVLKGVWNGGPFNYDGKFFKLDHAGLPEPLVRQRFPELYFVGSSDAALAAQGKHADFDLSHLEPEADLVRKFDRVRELASKDGRNVKPAVRFNIIARRTPEEAWAEVRRAWSQLDWDAREQARIGVTGPQRDSPRRGPTWQVRATRSTRIEELVVDDLWSGFGTLGHQGSPLGFVGSYEQAAERIDKFIRLGVGGFILSSIPALEESLRIGEEVLPLIRGSTPSLPRIQSVG